MLTNPSVLSNILSQLGVQAFIGNFLSFKIAFAKLVFLKMKYFHFLGFLDVLDKLLLISSESNSIIVDSLNL